MFIASSIQRLAIGFFFFVCFALGVRSCYVVRMGEGASAEEKSPVLAGRSPSLVFEVDGSAVLRGHEQFDFSFGGREPLLSPDNRAFMSALAAWMSAHPDRIVTITGRYYDRESGPGEDRSQNLGLARAAAVRDLMVKEHGLPEDAFRLAHRMAIAPAGANRSPADVLAFSSEN